ncbi:Helicase conserved C-terminal domain containing protein [Trichomonas vaginalis G3]|uniref:ATP-dependent RNA helicase n=1 Tax=Trichomonas vaginalis (strain ATCC PRA-98 / G3) TaxID=412133 RepID=A2E773_TRIV3|nr:helicase [Trichomonas vaginalis G3]EAY11470.1 Helicase conserved C-terminal domain containing protein [Trichomonas vaginalis G3]KAI5526767.1 RNA helicase protein [Trichomonas vaginalis G3]|eukprot:XP_001323693.1 helicase [Trichomonas vaginalis G3]
MAAPAKLDDLEMQLFFRPHDLKVIQSDKTSPYSAPQDWEDLFDYDTYSDLHQKLIDNNFEKPSSIQASSIQIANGEDHPSILGQAQNGSGKTLAFVVNSLLRVDRNSSKVQVVILVPNMELVDQTEEYFQKLAPEGVTYTKIDKNGADIDHLGQIVVTSPGLFFNAANAIPQLKDIDVFVVDECDEVITNKIYHEDLIKYAGEIKNAQFLLYSATLVDKLNDFINTFRPNMQRIILPQKNVINRTNKHFFIDCRKGMDKIDAINIMFQYLFQFQTFIFFNTRKYLQKVQKQLEALKLECDWCSGDRTKDERRDVVKKFREQKIKVLLTTNLLARGIDIPSCKVVINFDMPRKERGEPDYESYLHRQGRCGRFGKEGKVFNLIRDDEDMKMIEYIKKTYSVEITQITPQDVQKFAEKNK